uniref:Uncharacterized protein n=1 Tax=Anguilla anguilla TaxID=7936 RepID=A0A0E9T8E2_ANGAN
MTTLKYFKGKSVNGFRLHCMGLLWYVSDLGQIHTCSGFKHPSAFR